jgi:MarR family transcriptional regulator, transcriptional regulator for hemolysin
MRNNHLTLDHWLATAAGASDRALDRKLAVHGSTRMTFRVLWHLHNRPQENQADLARLIGVTGQTVSRHLDRLERADLITRYPDPYDRRSHVVQITPAGRETAGRLNEVSLEHEERVLQVFGRREALEMVDRLRRLVAMLDSDESDHRAARREEAAMRELNEILARRAARNPDPDPDAERPHTPDPAPDAEPDEPDPDEPRGLFDDAALDAFFGRAQKSAADGDAERGPGWGAD